MHISKVRDKSAYNLCSNILNDDPYHNRIANAALRLYEYKADIGGSLGRLVYGTQWSSGTTLWHEPDGNGTATVDKYGNITTVGILEPTYDGKWITK